MENQHQENDNVNDDEHDDDTVPVEDEYNPQR